MPECNERDEGRRRRHVVWHTTQPAESKAPQTELPRPELLIRRASNQTGLDSPLIGRIKLKLETPALIASDGSNTSIRELVAAANGDTAITAFSRHGLAWERTGSLPGPLSRQTVVWRVSPMDANTWR